MTVLIILSVIGTIATVREGDSYEITEPRQAPDESSPRQVGRAFRIFVNWIFPILAIVIFAMTCPERGFVQLYEFNPGTDATPTLVEGQDKTRNNTDACWTPDGKNLLWS